MDTVFNVETPEYSEFRFYQAGIFQRMFAYGLDHVFILTIMLLINFGFSLLGVFMGGGLAMFSTLFGILVAITVWWLYFIVLEALWKGQTLGKKILGIRVISDRGTPISWGQSFLRNLLRMADSFPYYGNTGSLVLLPFYGVGFFSCFFTQKRQRLGDLAAGTIVVRVEREVLLTQSQLDVNQLEPAMAGFPKIQLNRGDSQALIRYIHRRPAFSQARREELAEPFVERLRQRFAIPEQLSNDVILQVCYIKLFGVDR
ncbi:MAG: RDD family protein [Acidobacteria bacterium]|nr:RDD family protein [Acidobacteriota bacterium]